MSEGLSTSETGRPPAGVPRRRRRLSFGLRSVMVLVILLGCMCHWVGRAYKRHQDVLAIEHAGGRVFYSWQWQTWELERQEIEGPVLPPPYPAFLTQRLPADFFGEVVVVDIGESKWNKEVLAVSTHFRHLRALSVYGRNFNDSGLFHLRSMPQLESLEVMGIPLDDEQMRLVANLSNLKFLSISGELLTDDGLHQLGRLQKMEVFEMHDAPRTTNSGYAFLKRMPRLTELRLMDVPISDFSFLRNVPKLVDLYVYNAPVDNRSLINLKYVPQLRKLAFCHCPVSDDSLSHFGALNRLETLDLEDGKICGSGLGHIARLKNLDVVYLGENPIGDEGMVAICKSDSIRFLQIGDTQITRAGALLLRRMKNLKFLSLPSSLIETDGRDYYKDQLPGVDL